jgi:coproporphyrinogen III oxidase
LVCGGQDLTPYLFEEDAIHFHQTSKTACDNTIQILSKIKQCDAYFGMHIEMKLVDLRIILRLLQRNEEMKMEDWPLRHQ